MFEARELSGKHPGKLSGKRVVVAGASRGLGREIAGRFSQEGARVYLIGRNPERLREATDDMAGEAAFGKFDIVEPEEAIASIAAADEWLGGIDILVNSAGVGLQRHVLDTSLAEWQKVIDINLTGAFLLARESAKVMLRDAIMSPPNKRIIQISSVAGSITLRGRTAYGASKAGMDQMTKMMAVDLAPLGINCNVVAPGPIETPALKGVHTAETRRAYESHIPQGRYGVPQEVADATLFLASDESAYIVGHVMNVDGGMVATGVNFALEEDKKYLRRAHNLKPVHYDVERIEFGSD